MHAFAVRGYVIKCEWRTLACVINTLSKLHH